MGEWRETTLGEITINHDSRRRPVRSSERVPGPFPYYGASGVVDHVADYLFDGQFLLISEDGENLKTRSTPIAFLATGQFWVNNHAHVVQGAAEADIRFINYLLALTDVAPHLSGSAQPKLSRASMDAIRLKLPGLAEQRAIADVLGALDDKIAANARLIDTADSLATAHYGAVAACGEPSRLTALADFINGRAFTKDASGTGRVVIRIAELNSGIGGSTVFSDAEVSEMHLARPGDILFAWSGSLTLHRWFRPEAIVNQHIFKVVPHAGRPAWLVWHAIAARLDYFRAVAADKATTMGHIQRHHLDEEVILPRPEAVADLDAEMSGLWDRALSAEQENLTLAATRDALLPALMSGALRVRDAERIASDLD